MTEHKWYIVYTKSRCEQKVASFLSKKLITNYCPLHPVYNQLLDSRKQSLEPLFTSYVFVYIREDDIPLVLKTPGIINFIYWLNEPATIAAEEIESLKQLLGNHHNYKVEKSIIPRSRVLVLHEADAVSTSRFVSGIQSSISLPSLGFCISTTQLNRQ